MSGKSMQNRLTNDFVTQLSLFLFIGIISMLVVFIGGNTIGPLLPFADGATTPAPSSHDTSVVAAVITINENSQGNTVFRPERVNIMQGGEIFIGNNSTSPQSITSGTGPKDPLSGKLFNTGILKPKEYAEFVTANLNPGTYPYYSSTNPSVKGLIIVQK
jgi:plastocyanin